MAGVTIFERPTRADFRYGESAALPVGATPKLYRRKKAPTLLSRLSLRWQGWRDLNFTTRADFRNSESAALPVTATPNLLQ